MSLLIFAGSETTRTVLASIVNQLLHDTGALKKATEEVRSIFQTEDEITELVVRSWST
jgi:cytochrome P450